MAANNVVRLKKKIPKRARGLIALCFLDTLTVIRPVTAVISQSIAIAVKMQRISNVQREDCALMEMKNMVFSLLILFQSTRG